jgi:hypothetical protein
VQFNEFKEKVRVCKNCFNALEKTYTDHLASTQQQQQQQKTIENTETTTNNNNLTSTSDVELTSSNKTSKFLSDHNQPIVLLSGIMKNITDSFGFTNSNSSNNTTVTNTNTNTPSTNASTTTINTLETKESSGATNDDDEFDFDSFDEDDDDSSDQLDTAAAANNQPQLAPQTSIIRVPPPTPAKNGFAHSYSRLPETSTKSAILKTNSGSSISIAAANKLKRFTTVKKQPKLAEYGYLAKIAIDQQEQQRNSVKWERSYFVLYDDLTVAVFSNHTV